MCRLLGIALLLVANTAALGATVTLDFEALPAQPAPTKPDPAQWVDQGFVFEGSDDFANGSFPGGVVSAGVGFAPFPAEFGNNALLLCGTCGVLELTLSEQGGAMFDLVSFDQSAAFPGGGDTWSVTGYLAGGGEVSTTFTTGNQTVVFDSTWANLSSVSIVTGDAGNALDYRLDNFVVQVVPVPAAFWLLGSALVGLFFGRRGTRFRTAPFSQG